MIIDELRKYPNVDINLILSKYTLFEKVNILDKVLFGDTGNGYLKGTLEEKYSLLTDIYNKRIIC